MTVEATSTMSRRVAVGGALAERRPAWLAGVIGMVLAHLGLFWIAQTLPGHLWVAGGVEGERRSAPVFEIELAAPVSGEESQPTPRFVEINPAAPENTPDRAPFVGAQNQQAAQPVPDVASAATPAVAGDGDDRATALVSGELREPEQMSVAEQLAEAFAKSEPTAEEVEATERARQAEAAARAVNALGGGESLLGVADGSPGATVTRLPDVAGAETGERPVAGTATGRSVRGGYFSGQATIDPNRPRDRPRLGSAAINARSSPTIRNEFGTHNIGVLAYDAKWSAYGEYLQRLIDAVQAQWERLILMGSYYPVSGTVVRVAFKLDSAGLVSEVIDVDGGGELARRLCISAITERAPYGAWSEDMIAVLGREQEITFTFHYQ